VLNKHITGYVCTLTFSFVLFRWYRFMQLPVCEPGRNCGAENKTEGSRWNVNPAGTQTYYLNPIHTWHAVSLPWRAVNSHIPCRAPVLLRQCRVLRESPRGSRKYPKCYSNSLTDRLFCSVLLPLFTVVGVDRCAEDWYASDNNLRGTPRGSRKKQNAGR
jgi:hypothetical protein